MPSITQQPPLTPLPNLEPPGFNLLRDLLMRKLINREASPYGFSGSPQQAQALFTGNGRGMFDPYSGGYGGGQTGGGPTPGSMELPGGGVYGQEPGNQMGPQGGMGGGPPQGGGGGTQAGPGMQAIVQMLAKSGSQMGADGYTLNNQISRDGDFDGCSIGHDGPMSSYDMQNLMASGGRPSGWGQSQPQMGHPDIGFLGPAMPRGGPMPNQGPYSPGRRMPPSMAGGRQNPYAHGGPSTTGAWGAPPRFGPSTGTTEGPGFLGSGGGPMPGGWGGSPPSMGGGWGPPGVQANPGWGPTGGGGAMPGWQPPSPGAGPRYPMGMDAMPGAQPGIGAMRPMARHPHQMGNPQHAAAMKAILMAMMAKRRGQMGPPQGAPPPMMAPRPMGMDSPYHDQRGPMSPLGMDGYQGGDPGPGAVSGSGGIAFPPGYGPPGTDPNGFYPFSAQNFSGGSSGGGGTSDIIAQIIAAGGGGGGGGGVSAGGGGFGGNGMVRPKPREVGTRGANPQWSV